MCLVGDFLDFCGTTEPQLTSAEAALSVALLEVPELIFARGNHEDFAWFEFQDAWATTGRKLVSLHGEVFTVGPATIIGFPCLMGDETAFVGERRPLPASPNAWLSRLLERHGPSIRTLWLMHEPPAGTPLSQFDSPVAGNPKWRSAIERIRPILTISGHDHQTPIRNGKWHHRIGSTTCVNVGQTEHGPLHYCIVEAEFSGDAPSLPTRMTVTAHPQNETAEVYPPTK